MLNVPACCVCRFLLWTWPVSHCAMRTPAALAGGVQMHPDSQRPRAAGSVESQRTAPGQSSGAGAALAAACRGISSALRASTGMLGRFQHPSCTPGLQAGASS